MKIQIQKKDTDKNKQIEKGTTQNTGRQKENNNTKETETEEHKEETTEKETDRVTTEETHREEDSRPNIKMKIMETGRRARGRERHTGR